MKPAPDRTPGPIDWREVHERLDRGAAALAGGDALTPEQVRGVLDQRARDLARVPVRPPSASETTEIITFSVAGEWFALETRYVRRVLSRWRCTPVPGAPEGLAGVTNLHGEVLVVFDARAVFGVARREGPAPAQLLVLGEGRDELGLLAEAVGDVRSLRTAELLDPPASFDALRRGALRGVTADVLVVVDGRALLADERLTIQQADEPGA
jgi:purine-binding chemotaxis protein CheW